MGYITMPTIGLKVREAEYNNMRLRTLDLGGPDVLRPLLRHYYQEVDGLIYVVDSSDHGRCKQAKDELAQMLTEDALRDVVLLVFANKQDLPNAMTVDEVKEKLGLHRLHTQQWLIQPICATTGDGLYEGLDLLSHKLPARRHWSSSSSRVDRTCSGAPLQWR